MNKEKTALFQLWKNALKQGSYRQTASYSCVKNFVPVFPEQPDRDFIKDSIETKFNGQLYGKRKLNVNQQ